jgi:surface polysaccharide O-acyltransferase-like enzyme
LVKNLNQIRGHAVYVDLIRTVAMIGVILLHASGRWLITSQELNQMNQLEFLRWVVVDIYQSMAVISVPLFLMLTGALLLQPEKDESLTVFFKKRWARIGLPFLFWISAYFVWDFLVKGIPFDWSVIVQGLLNGPYTHIWYMYVLIGLYLLTPIFRIFIAHANQEMIKYFIILWFVGVATIPFFNLLTIFKLHQDVFALTGYIGFFVLGTYLPTVKMRRSTIAALMAVGIALTVLGTYVLAVTGQDSEMYFFQEYRSPTVILSSVMVFMMLLTVQPPSVQKGVCCSKLNRLVKLISQNTLSIYLFHVMVIESFQNGYLGFAINRDTMNSIIEIPLLTTIVLFVSLAIILLSKKLPYLPKLLGCTSFNNKDKTAK